MEQRAVYEGELELRASGRRLAGRFPYSQKSGDRQATVMNKGRIRKERIGPDAFGWQIREFSKLQDELATTISNAVDEARVQIIRQELERRNIHVLAGHSYDKPMGDMLRSGARVTSTREALEFEVELPPEGDQPGYMRDAIAMIRAGLIGGISPGFRVPPKGIVANAERLEAEPGNPAVQVRVIENAVLSELSIVTRPAYSETDIDVRALEALTPSKRVRVWL